MNKAPFLIIIPCLVTVLYACGTSSERQKMESLSDAIDNYAYALRWGRIDDAVSYHINAEGDRPEIDTSVMDPIRVTGFSIRDREINPEQTEATVQGELNYYHDEYGTLRTLEYTQHWWYQEESKQWFLDNDFPEFR